MELIDIRLIIDFGFVILIWMVQLLIYPSFIYFEAHKLEEWHSIYTRSITFIVAPMFFAQTGIIAFQLIEVLNSYTIISFLIVLSLWGFTFFEAVPLHQKIQHQEEKQITSQLLVKKNKKRTLLWTLLFILSLIVKLYF